METFSIDSLLKKIHNTGVSNTGSNTYQRARSASRHLGGAKRNGDREESEKKKLVHDDRSRTLLAYSIRSVGNHASCDSEKKSYPSATPLPYDEENLSN